MKTIATAAVFMMLTTAAYADEQDNKSATADEPILLSEAEMDGVTAGFVGLERIGGVMIYDVSDPISPSGGEKFTAVVNHLKSK